MKPANPIIKYATMDYGHTPIEFKNELEYIQFVLYQSIYAGYIHMFNHGSTPLVNEYLESVSLMIKRLNPNPTLFQEEKQVYDTIYYLLTHTQPGVITWKQIDEALSYPCFNEVLKEMVPHRDFYLPLLSALGYGYPTDIYPEGKKPGACLYIPSLVTVEGSEIVQQLHVSRYPGVTWITPGSDNNKRIIPHLIIHFKSIVVPDYDFLLIRKLKNMIPSTKLDFFEYLSGFNFSALDLDNIFGLLSNFALEKGVASDNGYSHVYNGLFSTIYDTIVGENTQEGKQLALPKSSLFKMLTILKEYHRIGNLEDTKVFSIFVSKCVIDRDVSNYLAKPTNLITANEAMAFRNSVIAEFIVDKLLNLPIYKKGIEALDDTSLDTTSEEDPSLENDMIPENPEDAQFPDDNIPMGDGSPPPRDPVKLLLELASPEESFADFIYKKLVSARIRDLLNNTPKDLPVKEVLLLKKWLTHWINLTSANTIKDFLSRLSFRLNDLELTHKSI